MIRIATKPAAAYYRMSTDRQEASIPAQREAVEKYAAANGYEITAEYLDEGISGDATEKRHQFKRMVADAERREFEAILCWDQDRFGRFDSIEAGRWIYPLRQAGVHLATVAQGQIDWHDFAGRMMFGIQTEAKHQFLVDLSRNVTRGMRRLAEQGKWSGKPPIGYVLRDKQLEAGAAADVALVRNLFRQYAAGVSLRSLAAALNGAKQLSPFGKLWSANGIASILKNRAYVGDFIWNRECKSKYKRKRAGTVNQEGDWIVFERHHAPLIERELFERVQKQLRQRRTCTTPKPNGGGFVLSGIIYCGHCGSRMTGNKGTTGERYSCKGHNLHGPGFCEQNRLLQTVLLDAILGAVERQYFNPAMLERLATECRRQLKAKGTKPEADKMRKEMATIDAKLDKAKRRLVEVDADLVGDVSAQIRQLRSRRDVLAATLKAAGASSGKQADDVEAKVQAALVWFGKLKAAAKRSDPQALREFIREAFEKVEIWAAKVPFTAKRFKWQLDRGCLYLKQPKLLSLPCPGWNPRKSILPAIG